jgi:DNA-binding LacI/PurR family transcriptional regulator
MAAGPRRAEPVEDESPPSSRGVTDRPVDSARPVTMKDIASATGVSRSTVSRVLSHAPLQVPIALETRQRVEATARSLGYRPNPLARALRGAPTMLLGAIVRDITDPFFAGAVEAVSGEARRRGYNIVLGHAHAQATEAFALATMLEARQCDAILLLGDMGDQPRLLDDLRTAHVPVVAMWQGSELDLTPAVNVDNRIGIATGISHLRSLGHRRIAFVGGRLLGDIRERRAAYAEAMSEEPDTAQPDYVQLVANTPVDGEAALQVLMRLSPRPTAVVASTDVLAIGVLRGALVMGIRVPDELSVVGFDDIPFATSTMPALTTMRMPMAEMASAAIELAIGSDHRPRVSGARDDGRPGPSDQVLVRMFRPGLVIRESTGPCPVKSDSA